MKIDKASSKLANMSNEQIVKCLSNANFVSNLMDVKFNYGKDGVDEFLIKEAAMQVLKTPNSVLEKAKDVIKKLDPFKFSK